MACARRCAVPLRYLGGVPHVRAVKEVQREHDDHLNLPVRSAMGRRAPPQPPPGPQSQQQRPPRRAAPRVCGGQCIPKRAGAHTLAGSRKT